MPDNLSERTGPTSYVDRILNSVQYRNAPPDVREDLLKEAKTMDRLLSESPKRTEQKFAETQTMMGRDPKETKNGSKPDPTKVEEEEDSWKLR